MKNNKIYNNSAHGFVTMLWTGMRPSECTALRIGDVDLKNGFIIVNKSRTLGEENVTKTTGSTRIVRLLTHVAAVLRSSKELRVTEDDYFFKNHKRAGRRGSVAERLPVHGATRQGDPERASTAPGTHS